MSDHPAQGGPKCPICGRPTMTATRPFCSRRCADADLVRWVNGAYRIPVADDEAEQAPGSDGTEAHGLIPRIP